MESPSSVSSRALRNSKRRVFPGASSSSGFNQVEVLDLSPTNNITSKSNSFRVIDREIIDLVDDDDSTVRSMKRSGKGKEAFPDSRVRSYSECDISKTSILTSALLQRKDDWVCKYYDDLTFDDQEYSQPHFDHMNIPHEVEASFPRFPNNPHSNVEAKETSSSPGSSSQIKNSTNISQNLQQSSSLKNSMSSKLDNPISVSHLKRKKSFKLLEYGRAATHALKKFMGSQPSGGPNPGNNSVPQIVTRRHTKLLNPTLQSNVTIPSVPSTAFGAGSFMHAGPSVQNGTTPSSMEQTSIAESLQCVEQFKKFDTVEDYSDHHFAKSGSSSKNQPKNWAKRIQEEWKSLEKNLPEKIFVRVYESRMDLLRAVIVGAEGTPYHDGLYFFDVHFPINYPNVPPLVHYHSGGLRINPNLYNCGKVCLSLLNTWSGAKQEKWVPGVSTMLQILVSIQGLILNVKPYFNEPGYERSNGSKHGEEKSLKYNESTFLLSLKTMVYAMRKPPKAFEDFVVEHFRKNAREILMSCKAYMEGVQVGCLVKGGVQDVDASDNRSSKHFRKDLSQFITTLIDAFAKIGANDCEEFLSLSFKS